MLNMTERDHYQVHLDIYQGPLDLLLQLIERQEMDITQVSLARVTDQYLAHIALLGRANAEYLAEFLLIAAKLLLIKSRALLPKPPAIIAEEEEDVGQDLVEQLKLYRQFKQMAVFLHDREEAGLRSFPHIGQVPKLERHLTPGEGNLDLLSALMRQVLEAQSRLEPVNGIVAPVVISIADKIAYIGNLLQAHARVTFGDLLRRCASRMEIIVTFMAVLEMLKQAQAEARQERPFGEILITPAAPVPADVAEPVP
jgi:segregation and condensation protein A